MAEIPNEVKDHPVDDPSSTSPDPPQEPFEEIKTPRIEAPEEKNLLNSENNPVTENPPVNENPPNEPADLKTEEEHTVLAPSSPINESIRPIELKTSPPGSPKIFISLKSPKNETFKHSNLHLEIADSLFDRNLQKEAKISKLRVEKKANEISQLQSIPTINKKSKQMTSTSPISTTIDKLKGNGKYKNEESEQVSDDSFLQLIPDSPKSVTQSKINKAIKEHAVFDNSELIKSAVKLRENLPVKAEKKVGKRLKLDDRNKLTKEKKLKRIKEAEQQKKIKEVEGCTFKPRILGSGNQISESGTCIIKRSNSGSIIKNELASPCSPRANRAVLEFFDNFQMREAKTFSAMYSQMSPVNYHVRHKHGYDVAHISSNGRPMVDYRILASNLLE